MRIILVLFSILFILTTNSSFSQNKEDKELESYPLLIDKILGKPISEFMENPNIDQIDKDFILGKVAMTKEDWLYNTLTKLSTIPKSQEPFYLHILNIIVLEVDGAEAEVIGSYAKHFLLRSSKAFCEFFSTYEGAEKDKLISQYAGFLAQEFNYAENPEEAFLEFKGKFSQKCRLYRKNEKEFSRQFLMEIKNSMG